MTLCNPAGVRARIGRAAVFALLASIPAALAADLPFDSRVQRGTLPNGVKWMYRQHDNPPGKMALMINIDTGSLNETDAQRGLAHFIEHMAFNGTENYPPGKLIPYFESIGMEFGADLNAFTSLDQTAYMLFTPNTETEQLEKALTVLSDYAFRITFVPEEIEKERGVIMSEKRSGENAGQRIRDQLWPKLYAGSRVAVRLPIGIDDVIQKAPREEFLDYYQTWYRPELVTVMAVGDAPADRVIPLIEKWFGAAKAARPARPAHTAELKATTEERAIIVSDPDWSNGQVQMTAIRPGRPPTTTEALYRTELVEVIGRWIMGRRFEENVRLGKASYRSAGGGVSSLFRDAVSVSLGATGEPADWAKMLDEVIVEANRARAFGFLPHELELAKTALLADAERSVRTEPTVAARALINQLNGSVNSREPILAAAAELELQQRLLPTITAEEVAEAFRKNYAPGGFSYVLTLPQKEGVALPTEQQVLDAARAAHAKTPEKPSDTESTKDLLAAEPAPGKLSDVALDSELNISSGWLSNGIRVHHRFMDYKKDTVLLSIAFAGGRIEETAENAGITDVATRVVSQPATSRLNSREIGDLMTGKNIRVAAGAGVDTFRFQLSGSPRDLEQGLRLAHALITDGRMEESAFANWQKAARQQRQMFESMPEFVSAENVVDLTTGGDIRLMPMNFAKIDRQNMAAAQKWYERIVREAPIEVAVVGEIELKDVQPLLEKYIGSLPQRKRTGDHLKPLRGQKRAKGPLERVVQIDTKTDKAMVQVGWVGGVRNDVHEDRALQLARLVLSTRLVQKIREELGLVYSIRATRDDGAIFDDSGKIYSGAPCHPTKGPEVAAEIEKVFDAFGVEGPTADELANAKKQIRNNLDEGRKEPSYWLAVLQALDLSGRDLDEEKRELAEYDALTAERVRDTFRKYNTPERRFRVVVAPRADASTTQPAAK